jgi:hypothetical protein
VLSKRGYTLVGDVHPAEAAEVAGKLTPVPGGVGLLTVAMLMKNTLARTAQVDVLGLGLWLRIILEQGQTKPRPIPDDLGGLTGSIAVGKSFVTSVFAELVVAFSMRIERRAKSCCPGARV